MLLSQGQEYNRIGMKAYIKCFITETNQMQFDLSFKLRSVKKSVFKIDKIHFISESLLL